MQYRVLRCRAKITHATAHEDVSAGTLVWLRIRACIRTISCGTFLLSALATCNVYDGAGNMLPANEAGGHRDGDYDANRRDAGAPSDGAGGKSGSTGSDVGDVGSGGVDAGARDVAGGGASGQDVRTDGSGGQDVGITDLRSDQEGGGGFRGDGASDGSEGGVGDAAADCIADVCTDGPAIDTDGPIDQCPTDPAKTEPGICGCGTADTDSDNDGTADCIDGCPADTRKTQPGLCGCNADDPPDRDAGQAFCLKALLAHRYSFEGSGAVATDSVGMANGAVVGGSNATMSGGSVTLSGDLGARYTNEGYVSLPSDLLNPLTNATFEVWLTWRGTGSSGGRTWQRIFDFGDQTASGSDLVGNTYLFLTTQASGGFPRAAFSSNGPTNETFVTASQAMALNAQVHVAVVVDDANDNIALYLNGDADGSVAWTGTLAAVNDVNVWLGRSNFAVDPELNGIMHEFRIYRVALTETQIRASYAAGPNPPFF